MNSSSVIYRGIITSKFRTENLYNFYNSVGDGKDKKTIFVSFGRSEPWADNEKDAGFAPPYPNDSSQGVMDVWSNMIGSVKVEYSMLDAVIPRKDWGDVRFANSRNFKIGEIIVTNTAPYNKAPTALGWVVYKVVDIPDTGVCSIGSIDNKEECLAIGGKWTSSVESYTAPTGRGDTEGLIDTGDGYLYEYLYEIPPDVSINRCTNSHIVIPWPDEIRENPSRWGYQNNLTWQVDDFGLIYRLKANTIRFKAYLDSVYFPESTLLGNTGFRQLAVIINPFEKRIKNNDPYVKADKPYYDVVDLERHSGEVIYMENRQPITRAMDQTEEIQLIFEF